nr:MAG TPA: hypothetical protein [Bacteriophage sp.]
MVRPAAIFTQKNKPACGRFIFGRTCKEIPFFMYFFK